MQRVYFTAEQGEASLLVTQWESRHLRRKKSTDTVEMCDTGWNKRFAIQKRKVRQENREGKTDTVEKPAIW